MAQSSAGTVLDDPHTLALDDHEGLLTRLTGIPGLLIVLAAPEDVPRVDEVLALASALDPRPVAVCPTTLPPLGVNIARYLVASFLEDLGLGAALAAAARIEELVFAVTLVESVAKLDSPSPSLAQTGRSWLPGARYAVTFGTESAVRSPDELVFPAGFEAVARGHVEEAPTWSVELENRWAPTATVHDLNPGDLFGNSRWSEIVWIDRDGLDALAAELDVMEFEICTWCSNERVGDVCAICGFASIREAAHEMGDEA